MFEEPQMVMLALYLPESVAIELAIPGGLPPNDLHLTLGYYGRLSELPLETLLIDLQKAARSLLPVEGRISGVGRFSATESSDNKDVIYVSFDSINILAIRQAVLNVASRFMPLKESHGYTPHITLAYVDPEEELQVDIEPRSLTFSTLTLTVGEDLFDLDLLGTPVLSDVIMSGTLMKATDSELLKINQYTSAGETLTAENVFVVRNAIAADNLLNRSLSKWGIKEIQDLSKMLPGLPITLNHQDDLVEKVQGVVFDARAVERKPTDNILALAGNGSLNQIVFAAEGYWVLEFDFYLPANSPAIDPIKYGILSRLSLGGFDFKDYICPLCNKSFEDKPSCPHYPPQPWYGLTADTDPLVAPYSLRSKVFDLGEVSFVLIGNLPGAMLQPNMLIQG